MSFSCGSDANHIVHSALREYRLRHKRLVQIFKLDFSSSSQDLQVAGQPVNAPERFHRLSWNAFVVGTPEQEKYPVTL